MTAELDRLLADVLPGRRVVVSRRRPYAYRTSFPLDEVEVELDGGSELRLVLKAIDRNGLGGDALRAKPEFLFDATRELEFDATRELETYPPHPRTERGGRADVLRRRHRYALVARSRFESARRPQPRLRASGTRVGPRPSG